MAEMLLLCAKSRKADWMEGTSMEGKSRGIVDIWMEDKSMEGTSRRIVDGLPVWMVGTT